MSDITYFNNTKPKELNEKKKNVKESRKQISKCIISLSLSENSLDELNVTRKK